jgi:hypothetical protein
MRTTLTEGNTGLRWTLCTTLEDTDYADDLALLSHTEDHMQEKTRTQSMAIIKSTDDIAHPCLTPDFTRKLVSASELMVHEKFV